MAPYGGSRDHPLRDTAQRLRPQARSDLVVVLVGMAAVAITLAILVFSQ